MNNEVSTRKDGHICWITLDRPKANAIDSVTSRKLYKAVADFESDETLRVAILTAAGDRFFSAGWDLKAAAQGEAVDADHGPGGFAGITEYFNRKKPIIAAVNGLAVGGGFELALACDFIIAAQTAQFFLPESSIGIIPDSGGLFRLSRLLPRPLMLDLALTGRRMSAEEAIRWGLINQIVDLSDLLDAAKTYANHLLKTAPLAQQATLELLNATQNMSLEQAFHHQRNGDLPAYRKMLVSEDAKLGINGFSDGNTPSWTGK